MDSFVGNGEGLDYGLDSCDCYLRDSVPSPSLEIFDGVPNGHVEKLDSISTNLNKIREEGLLCDATIFIKSRNFLVHKVVLAASSPYFRAMFTGPFTEKNKKCIEIKGISETMFNDLLDYMYGKELYLTVDTVMDVFLAADMLCVDELMEGCRKYFKEHWKASRDYCAAYEMAVVLKDSKTVDNIIQLAQKEITNTFSGINRYKEYSYEFINKVFENYDHYKSCGEMSEGFQAKSIVKWAFHKPQERLPEQALQLLSNIKFEFIVDSDFKEMLKTTGMEVVQEEIVQMFRDGLKAMYDKPLSLIRKHNIKITRLEVSDGQDVAHLLVFDSSTWKWESKNFPYFLKYESACMTGDEIYMFGKDCFKVNTQTQVITRLPSLPDKRTKFSSNIVNNTLYLVGGLNDNKQCVRKILQLKPGAKSWTSCQKWHKSKCKALTIPYGHCLYIVGGISRSKLDSSEVSMYNCLTGCNQLVCNLQFSMTSGSLAVFDGQLFVFNNCVVCINLEKPLLCLNFKYIPWCDKILNVCSVAEGILLAFNGTADNVLLGILKPQEEFKIEFLGYVPQQRSNSQYRSFETNPIFISGT